MMYYSAWCLAEDKDTTKKCDGCDLLFKKGSRYMNVKFTLEDGSNVVKLMNIFLCTGCIEDFGDFVEGPDETV